jgi:ABC-type multidrug transport system ATPase subunit
MNLFFDGKVNQESKSDRVRQILDDLGLATVAHHQVGQLTQSEHLRLLIAIQIVRDPSKYRNI